MSNNAFYGFDDDDEKPVKNGTAAGNSTAAKKKKKKKKSKKTDKNKKAGAQVGNAGINNNPAFVLKQKLMKQGYQSSEIDKCLDIMFTSGEQYDDYESVKAKLDGKEVTGKSNDTNTNSNTNSGTTNHEQVRAASNNNNNNSSSNNNDNKNSNRSPSDSNNNSNGWESVSKKKGSNSNNNIENGNNNDNAEPTIADRLEAATKMKPCSTVMEVLTRWCMQFPDDLIELFRCKAAAQLFENYLTDRYLPNKQASANDVGLMLKLLTCIFKEKLSKLIMSNLKSFVSALKDLSLDNDEWRLVVKRYSNLLSSRLSEFMQYGDQIESIPQDLKKLQDHLQANIVAADEFGNDNGDENIANSFRRRDLACERVVLGSLIRKNTARLAKAVGSNISSSSGNKNNKATLLRDEKNDARILESLGMSVQRINESNQKGEEAKEVQKQLNKLRAESKRKIEPLEKEERQTNDALSTLEEKKRQLLKDLESVQGELDILYGTKSSVAARKAEINMEMEKKLTKLDNEHKGMAVHLRRAESQSKIAKDFREFDQELVKQSQDGNAGAKVIQDRLANALQNAGGANAVNKRSNDVLRTALSYTRMELNCLSLMRNRVKDNKEKIVKTAEEIVSMKALGLTNVVSQLERTEKQLAQYIEQDEGVVGALSNKAVEIFNIVKAIGDDHAKDIDSLDGLTSDLLQKLKKSFIELNINNIPARNWNPPKVEGAEDNGSNSMFSSNLAASLGIAPTKSSSSSTTNATPPPSSSVTKSNSNKTNNNDNKKKQKKKSSATASGGPAKKMGWGAIPKQQKAGKSLLELQAEELEGRLTEENLRRLEIGKAPAKSPLLDRLKEQIEGGQ